MNYNHSILIQGIISFLLAHAISNSFDYSAIFSNFFNWLYIASILFIAAYIFVLTGKEYWKLIAILAFCQIPLIFSGPINIYAATSPIIGFILKLVISLWVLNLNLVAIAEVCKISKKKAILIYLLVPLLVSYILVSALIGLITNLTMMVF